MNRERFRELSKEAQLIREEVSAATAGYNVDPWGEWDEPDRGLWDDIYKGVYDLAFTVEALLEALAEEEEA